MAQAAFPDDILPPEGIYDSRESLLMAINSWAKPRGYAFATGKSTKTPNRRVRVVFACDRNKKPPNPSTERKRRTYTRGTACKFSVLAKESLDGTSWVLSHRAGQEYAIHNHEPSQHPSAHPAHRQLSSEDRSTLTSLTSAGIAPKDIRTFLRQNLDIIPTQQDIYNRIADSRRELCEGQSTIHALVNQLDEEGFWNRIQLDPNGRVTAILFAHPESLAYLQAYPDLLFLDCTYKTNKYGMPLLDMIGVDACQRSFCIAFAFLSGETEEDYIWVLDRLRSMYELCGTRLPSVVLTDRCIACMNAVSYSFPAAISLLCLWHANKAVLRYCQPSFVQHKHGSEAYQRDLSNWNEFFDHWHSIIKSADEETFDQRVQEIKRRYLPEYLDEVGYIKTTWLDLYKEKLVKAWVDQHPHFGNVVTSRVEGIHALLKSHLKTSTLDLFEAWRAMKHALLNQLAELRYNQAKQQTRIPIELSGSLYSAVRGWISHEALRKVEEQRERLLGDLPNCTGAFTRSQGLPCAHTLKALQEQGQALRLENFHTQWHLNRSSTHQLLLEPRHRSDRITASSTRLQSSTRRDPSAFEAVEAATRPRSQPKCSRCHILGHIMTSKACPLRHEELSQSVYIARSAVALAELSPEPAPAAEAPVPAEAPAPAAEALEGVSSYDDPQSIYQRHVAGREAWYKAQPRGSIKTNQQYRKAMGLPLRYSRASYQWCLDWKQMNKQCRTHTGSRDWTKEEMMAYLDWDKSENDRIEAQMAVEIDGNLFSNRRGVGEIWRAVERDLEEQEALYSSR